MGALNAKQAKFLDVLRGLEKSGKTFTVEGLTTMTEWTIATVKTYVGKKLLGRFVFETDQPGRYVAKYLVELPESDFAAVISQNGSCDGRSEEAPSGREEAQPRILSVGWTRQPCWWILWRAWLDVSASAEHRRS